MKTQVIVQKGTSMGQLQSKILVEKKNDKPDKKKIKNDIIG